MITIVLVLFLCYIISVVVAAHLYRRRFSICSQCGSNSGEQAIVWPFRELYLLVGSRVCKECGSLDIDFDSALYYSDH